jgi:hypothetical protein
MQPPLEAPVMLALFGLGGEIILILALVLILFGAKKLPELVSGKWSAAPLIWNRLGS